MEPGGEGSARDKQPLPRTLLTTDDRLRRAVLRAVEDAILQRTANAFERLVALDRYGAQIAAVDGDANGAVFSPRTAMVLLLRRPWLLTHNHIEGTPPSHDDVAYAAAFGADEVDSFSRTTRWRLVRGPAGWPASADMRRRFAAQVLMVEREVYDRGIAVLYAARRVPTAGERRDLWIAAIETLWQTLTAQTPQHWTFLKEER